jgi:hypothetical protein
LAHCILPDWVNWPEEGPIVRFFVEIERSCHAVLPEKKLQSRCCNKHIRLAFTGSLSNDILIASYNLPSQEELDGAAFLHLTSSRTQRFVSIVKEVQLSRPELAFIIATRAMIGAGIALLLADRLSAEQRKAVGATLAVVGLVTTIPAVWAIFGKCG